MIQTCIGVFTQSGINYNILIFRCHFTTSHAIGPINPGYTVLISTSVPISSMSLRYKIGTTLAIAWNDSDNATTERYM